MPQSETRSEHTTRESDFRHGYRSQNVIECTDVGKTLGSRPVLDALSLSLGRGEMVAIVGPSGSGKSTLLHCLAGILLPDEGSVTVLGQDLSDFSPTERSEFRLANIGMIFQSGELFPELSIIENVTLPQRLNHVPVDSAVKAGMCALERAGFSERPTDSIDRLSGGQLQRVAIARAIAGSQSIVIADEPTASLDPERAVIIGKLLRDLAENQGLTVIVATHDMKVAAMAHQVLRLENKRLSALVTSEVNTFATAR